MALSPTHLAIAERYLKVHWSEPFISFRRAESAHPFGDGGVLFETRTSSG